MVALGAGDAEMNKLLKETDLIKMIEETTKKHDAQLERLKERVDQELARIDEHFEAMLEKIHETELETENTLQRIETQVLSRADQLILTSVYPAGEAPIISATAQVLAERVKEVGQVNPVFVEDVTALPDAIRAIAQANDIVVIMGAGSISRVPALMEASR
jgi:hypothetical protein